jgi:hypothetical protein
VAGTETRPYPAGLSLFTFYWYLILGGPIFIYQAGRAARVLLGKKV